MASGGTCLRLSCFIVVSMATDAAWAQTASGAPATCSLAASAIIDRTEPDFSLDGAQIAAAGTSALVTFSHSWTGDVDNSGTAGSAWVSATFPRGTRVEPSFNSAASCASSLHLAPTRFGSDVTRFTYGWDAENGGSGDRHFALTDRRGHQRTENRWNEPRALYAAGRADLVIGIAIGSEMRCADPCACSADAVTGTALRSFAFGPARSTATILSRYPQGADAPAGIAVAVGADRQAIAYIVGHALSVLRLDATGAAIGAPMAIASGELGAPTIAYRGHTLIALWAQREAPAGRYGLRFAQWDPESAAPPVIQTVAGSGADSALAPSIAVDGNRVLVAWTEGDLQRRGVIRVASTSGDLATALASPATITGPDANSRDPEVAITPDRAWVVWESYARSTPRGVLRLGMLNCP